MRSSRWTLHDPFFLITAVFPWQRISGVVTLRKDTATRSLAEPDEQDAALWTSCLYSHRPRAVLGRIHPSSAGDKLQHLLVGFTGIRHVAQRDDLPQQHSERPAGGETGQQLSPRLSHAHAHTPCSPLWGHQEQHVVFLPRTSWDVNKSWLKSTHHTSKLMFHKEECKGQARWCPLIFR